MILTCAIIDDEPLAVSLLESYVKKTPYLSLKGKYNSALNALSELNENPVDLLFLDIQMPELNGMEFSKIITPETRIIFTTAFEQYALDSYKVNALDYLLKPISYSDFLKSAQKALQWYELVRRPSSDGQSSSTKDEVDSIFIKTEYKLVQVDLRKVLYIEGLKDYVKIHLEGESRPILSLTSLKALEEKLPTDRFIRVHRSYIVQKQKIKVIDKARIVFGKEYIPVSESYKQELQNYINDHSV